MFREQTLDVTQFLRTYECARKSCKRTIIRFTTASSATYYLSVFFPPSRYRANLYGRRVSRGSYEPLPPRGVTREGIDDRGGNDGIY